LPPTPFQYKVFGYLKKIFEVLLQICWSGYYYLTPSGNPKNPWTKRLVDHSLASLAERHLGIIQDIDGSS